MAIVEHADVKRMLLAQKSYVEGALALGLYCSRLVDVTATLWSAGDVAVTLANSTAYLEAAGHVVMAWIWLEQMITAASQRDPRCGGPTVRGKDTAAPLSFGVRTPRWSRAGTHR